MDTHGFVMKWHSLVLHQCVIAGLALNRFTANNGTQWAAAFAYYAFFSLSPLIIILVTASSLFIDRTDAASHIITVVQAYVPIGSDNQRYIFDTISGVVSTRGSAGFVAIIMLAWAAMGFISTLIKAVGVAWNVKPHDWWKLPVKSFVMVSFMVIAVMMGLLIPVIVKMMSRWLMFDNPAIVRWYHTASNYLSALVVFASLSLFYKMAPNRSTRFSEVWMGALYATLLLKGAESLFVIYLRDFATFNAVYGAFGGIIALMMWIYLSGCILIYCACLCAVQADEGISPQGSGMARDDMTIKGE